MQLTFAKSGWRTGVALLCSIVISQVFTFVSAHHDWRAATDLLTWVSFALLLMGMLFGFTAKIGRTGRVLWVVSIVGYLVFLGVEIYRFYGANTAD
jgi:hypothetical protein